MSTRTLPYPLLKWAGGKGRVMSHIIARIPEKINTYYEPFLGGGAIFFELARQKRFQKAVIGDLNIELMNTYQMVQTRTDDLIVELKNGKYDYNKPNYLRVRALNPGDLTPIERAARFVFLNRTCFNGLYRVNGEGRFNVPFGKYKNPLICDEANIRAIAETIRDVDLRIDDFEKIVAGAKPGDVVYLDPPYLPLSDTAKFTAYNTGGFLLEVHRRLSLLFHQLSQAGVCCILSNSYTPITLDLYKGHEIMELMGPRNVGGPAEYRKPVKEIIVFGGAVG